MCHDIWFIFHTITLSKRNENELQVRMCKFSRPYWNASRDQQDEQHAPLCSSDYAMSAINQTCYVVASVRALSVIIFWNISFHIFPSVRGMIPIWELFGGFYPAQLVRQDNICLPMWRYVHFCSKNVNNEKVETYSDHNRKDLILTLILAS